MKKNVIAILCVVLFSLMGGVYAAQNITITGGKIAIPTIAIQNFTSQNPNVSSDAITGIIINDLNITGELRAIKEDNKDNDEIGDIANVKNTNYTLTGSISTTSINYNLSNDDPTSPAILTNSAPISSISPNIRHATHTISNQIYQKLTNTQGMFNSKIGFVAKDKKKYKIIVSDYDGFNQKILLTTKNPILSFTWNQDGTQIAYTIIENKQPVIYVQNTQTTLRYPVAQFDGSNYSPVFMPDNNRLIITSTTGDDTSQLYLIDNIKFSDNSDITPLFKRNFSGINTEPSVNNDNIVFTSDHDGGPQIFLYNMTSKEMPKRITFNLGNYNTTAKFSHDGNKILFVNRNKNILRTYVLDIKTNIFYPVSKDTILDISPSFAPNDKLVLLSSDDKMYIANTAGTIETPIPTINYSSIIDQSWSNQF